VVISAKLRPFYYRFANPVGERLAALGISPNFLSFSGLVLAIITALWIVFTKDFLIAGILLIVIALIDVIDGTLARVSRKVTKFGSYLDAMLDRYVEGIILFAVAYSTGFWILAFIVLCGAVCTSYAKARAAIEIRINNVDWPEFFERAERGSIFILGLILQGLIKSDIYYQNFIFWALVILAIVSHITVIQRMIRAKNLMRGE